MLNTDKRGIILSIVIGIIVVVVVLSTIILGVVVNQARLTHHQVSRIQALYAAKAGVIYALDKLRRNDDAACWPDTGSYTRIMRRSGPAACVIIEPTLPSSILQVNITVGLPASGVSGTRRVSSQAVYTYTP